MAAGIFLRIDGIPGDATDKDHKGWIALLSWSHAGQAGVAPCSSGDFSLTKRLDIASPLLFNCCANGKLIPKARVEFCDTPPRGGRQGTRAAYELEMVHVSGMAVMAAEAGASVESMKLHCERMAFANAPTARSGSNAGAGR